ncbi:type II toxin-antitoxin system RelB/DinJ family antitoxin [Curtanaerobium respiraculi]|uniref:type II toxin-antitoxin system RelB/DinJ family antitoxin n=1 Tax=Curtanaerobium respiraculi TaxID=2949669 RepID=UPI0024B38900|nr:translation repressor RelB [Curtanaerobium respiraculi]
MATELEPLGTKIPHDERTAFKRTCEAIGTTPSGALRIFVTCFNNYGGFPFPVRARQTAPEPFADEAEAMDFLAQVSDRMLDEAR